MEIVKEADPRASADAAPLREMIAREMIPPTLAENLSNCFAPLYAKAGELIRSVESLSVTDPTQLTEMGQARDARLALRRVRVDADKRREELKAESLRLGSTIQRAYNELAQKIEPMEEKLLGMEQFAQRIEAQRKAETKVKREIELGAFVANLAFYDLANMPEKDYADLLASSRMAVEKRVADEKAANDARIALAKLVEAQRKADDEKRIEEARWSAAQTAKVQAKLKAERDEAEKARKAAEKVAADAKARADKLAEDARQAKAAEAKKAAAEARAKKKAEKAPDNEKIAECVKRLIEFTVPKMSTDAGHDLMVKVKRALAELAEEVGAEWDASGGEA